MLADTFFFFCIACTEVKEVLEPVRRKCIYLNGSYSLFSGLKCFWGLEKSKRLSLYSGTEAQMREVCM